MRNTLFSAAAILTLSLHWSPVKAQKRGAELIDSLKKKVVETRVDTLKVRTLLDLATAYYRMGSDSCFTALHQALDISEKNHWKRGIANSENNLGLCVSDTGNNVGARKHFERSLALNRELDSKLNIVNNLVNIARCFLREGDFSKAYDNLYEALPIAESTKSDDHIALVANNLASAYIKQKNFPKAVEYAQMTLDHGKKAHILRHMINALIQLGVAHLELKDTPTARANYDSALVFARIAGARVEESNVLINRAILEKNPTKRLAMFLETEALQKQLGIGSQAVLVATSNIGSTYYEIARDSATGAKKAELLQKSLEYLSRAQDMAQTQHAVSQLGDILQMRATTEEAKGDYKSALTDFVRSKTINDSLNSQERKNELAGLEGKRNIAIKDQEIALNELRLSNQRKTSIGLVAGILILAGFGVVLYRQSRLRQKANAKLTELNVQLYEANKVKARFFGIMSHDLRSPIVNLLHFLHIQKEHADLLSAADQVRHREEITVSTENLLSTMESMLLWSKEQMESFHPNPTTLPVKDLFEYLQRFFGQPENVRLIFDDATDLMLTTDENYLRTIMQNLTSNAVKVLKDKPGAVVEWKAIKTAKEMIISITDNGPGMAPAQAKALTSDADVSNARDGFGFHVIRDLAKAIHCKVEVESEPGKGTIFLLKIEHRSVG